MDQLKVRSDAFGYCSFAVNSFVFVCLFVGLPPTSSVLRLSSFLIFFFKETLHTMLRYAKLSAKRSLGMTLLIQKYNFMSVKLSLAFFCGFNERNGNK